MSVRMIGLVLVACLCHVLISEAGPASPATDVPKLRLGRKLQEVVTLAEDTKNKYFDGGENGLSNAGLPYDLPDARRFCGLDSEGNCHFGGYLQVIGVFAFPGAVLAVLSLISLCVFFSLRLCCNCFGGRSPSAGCFFGGNKGECAGCCGDEEEEFKGYRHGCVVALIVLCVIFGVALIGTPVIGLVGNNMIGPGVENVFQTADNTVNHITWTSTVIRDKLAQLPYVDATDEINDALQMFYGFKDDISRIHDDVSTYNQIRYGLTIGLLAVSMLIGSFGCVVALTRRYKLSMCVGVFCFLASFLSWAMFGIHMPVGLVMLDACREAEVYMADANNVTAFGSTLQCTDGVLSSLEPMRTNARDGIFQAQDRICLAANTVCNVTTCYGVTCGRSNAGSFEQTVIEDFKYSCDGQCLYRAPPTSCVSGNVSKCAVVNRTFAECAAGCQNVDLRNISNTIVYNLGLSVAYQNILIQDVEPLISCSFVQGVVADLHGDICRDIAHGVDLVATGFLVPACLLVPFTIFMILGYKRFRKDIKARRPDTSTRGIQMRDLEIAEPPLQTVSARGLENSPSNASGSAFVDPTLGPGTHSATLVHQNSYRRTPSYDPYAEPPPVPEYSTADYSAYSPPQATAPPADAAAPIDPWASVAANMETALAFVNWPLSASEPAQPSQSQTGTLRSVPSEGGWHSDSRSDSEIYEPPTLSRGQSGYQPPSLGEVRGSNESVEIPMRVQPNVAISSIDYTSHSDDSSDSSASSSSSDVSSDSSETNTR